MLKTILTKLLADRTEKVITQELPIDRSMIKRVGWLMDAKHLKSLALLAVGGAIAVSLISSISKAQMIRRTMAREMKKQLAPVNQRLQELEEQNEELKRQNKQLQNQLEKA